MSAWALQRRISVIVTIIVMVVFAVSVGLFRIFYHVPSCDDGIQNGLEEGIDCGGVCPQLCVAPPEPLRDVWRRAFPVAEGVYAAVAYIENLNEDLYVPEVQFEFELYNAAGTLIGRVSKTTPIMPNGITPVFIPHIVTGKQEAAVTSFRFVREPKFAKQPYEYGLDIQDVYRRVGEGEEPYVRATAVNVGTKMVRAADFVALLYDEEGTAVAASNTFAERIKPGERREIQYTWPNPLTLRKGTCPGGQCIKQVERVEIIPVIRTW